MKLYSILFLVPILLGCTPKNGYFTIIDSTDLSYPMFCVSTKPNCKGEPITTRVGYNFDKLDSDGKFVKRVWSISMKEGVNGNIKKFKYGTPPEGWEQNIPPEPFELEAYYRVGGVFIFTCQRNPENNIECEVLEQIKSG